MLAVGSRVGTLFAQSIYTVSGPFHPFGGAVDIIVVEQEDGTFKSSPWYVKFGKFQGVLKRKEKKVVVSVNDVDANFHMYLDHKGEAYFLKDDVTDDSPLEIEDSAVPGTDDATSSGGENSVEPLAIDDSKDEEGQDSKTDHEKEESEDERGDDLELRFEGRGSSRELLEQSVGGRTAAAVLELALGSQAQEIIADAVSSPQFRRDGDRNSSELSCSNLESSSFADVCRTDMDTVACGTANHAVENQAVNLESSQGSSESTAFVVNADPDPLAGVSTPEGGTLEETQDPDRGVPGRSGEVIHGLLNKVVGLSDLSSSGPSTAVIANAALDSLTKVVSDTHSVPTSRHSCANTKQLVELSEENIATDNELREADIQVSQGIKANSTHTYADVCRTDVEPETTRGTVIHALLNQAVGIEVSQSSSHSTVLVANAALEALTAAALPEVATSAETQVPDWESSKNARKIIHGLLNKAIGLQASATSGPASALIAKAVLNSLSNVLSDTQSTSTSGNGNAEPRLVELPEADGALESEAGNAAASGEEAGSSVAETAETAIIPVNPETPSNDKLVFLVGGRQYPWTIAAPIVLGLLAFGQVRIAPARSGAALGGEEPVVAANGEPAPGTLTSTSSGGWRLWPFGRSARTPVQVNASSLLPRDSDALMLATDAAITSRITKEYMRRNGYGYYKKPRKVRTNSPSSQQLASLGLKEGSNKITFTFFTRVLGKQQVDARIYLWKWNARIVISDVDGTITKSDVLGQVMPLVGKDWTQSGVAKLFSAIKKNGYELMFLSARAISQAYITRHFLEGIKQDGQQLPDGPVVISPDGLFPSLYREVIRRAPHEFKIACLEDIKSLFPAESKPFYAGFGNRDTDELSYLKVGISKGKIFIINPKGEVMVNNQVDVKSYTSLHKRVDDMFPASFTEQEDFNEWNYWKLPLPEIEDDESMHR